MNRILLFDDVEENRTSISEALSAELKGDAIIEPFVGDSVPDKDQTYERSIENQLSKLSGISLIACDKELGLYDNYRGLSANAVSVVARNLGIPFCQYSRNVDGSAREIQRFRRLRSWDSEEITLEGEEVGAWAVEIAWLFRGFNRIAVAYAQKAEISKLKPSDALAQIMGRPDYATRISLYGAGDQSVLTEIFAFLDDSDSSGPTLQHRMPRVLGTWLLLSILRFPGLLVNTVAAASLLNIAVSDFDSAKDEFESARYTGPFEDLGEWWWREELEILLADAGFSDGVAYMRDRGVEVGSCLDPSTNERAGCYCMITKQPVSRTNSTGDINWFPSGADLSRIQNDKYEEITSLVNV
ncbi:MAG: hypothetical protein AAF670_08715 [Planctomycetota bacterium]